MSYDRNHYKDVYSLSLAGMSVTAAAGPYPIVPSTLRRAPRTAAIPRNTWLSSLGRMLAWGN